MLTYDEAVLALHERTKLPLERCRVLVRQDPQYAEPPAQLDQLAADATEDDHVAAGDRLMAALGFVVVRLSQKRASKITAGVPDRWYAHPRRRLALWWEAKAATGTTRPEQLQFAQLCRDAGVHHVLGPLDALKQWLVDNQVATFDARGLPQPIPIQE